MRVEKHASPGLSAYFKLFTSSPDAEPAELTRHEVGRSELYLVNSTLTRMAISSKKWASACRVVTRTSFGCKRFENHGSLHDADSETFEFCKLRTQTSGVKEVHVLKDAVHVGRVTY